MSYSVTGPHVYNDPDNHTHWRAIAGPYDLMHTYTENCCKAVAHSFDQELLNKYE